MSAMRCRSVSFAALPLVLAALAPSQNFAIPAPEVLRDRLGLTGGTVQPLTAPLAAGAPFEVRVILDGAERVLAVQPYDMRAPGFAVLSVEEGMVELAVQPPATYRGTVQGVPGSAVALTAIDGQLLGTVLLDTATYAIEPASDAMPGLPRAAHLVYRDNEVADRGFVCGVADELPPPVVAGGDPAGEPDGLPAVAEIALQIDQPMIQRFGSVQTAVNRVTGVMNSVGIIYTRDCGIAYTITRILTNGTPYTATTPSGVLSQFQSRWNLITTPRDVAQLFAGFPRTSTLGIANLSTICVVSRAYSVVWLSNNFAFHVATSAHELGHSWSANHCSGSGCRIMCAFLGGCSGIINSFGASEISRIVFFRNTRGCLN